MFGSAALEVALGLIFVYLVLSLVCSALNETISSMFAWRAKFLRRGIANLLEPTDERRGLELAGELYGHPLLNALIRPFSEGKKARYPSYIPSRTFVTALLDFEPRAAAGSAHDAIEKVPSAQARRALTALLAEAEGDVTRFRRSAEQWFDDAMERVSGWYRRRVQVVMWALALVLVATLNVDTVRVAQSLWGDQTVRDAVVARAQSTAGAADLTSVAGDVHALDELAIPIGWSSEERPAGFSDWLASGALKALGLLLTAAALTLGAPFWFDALSKIARIRSAGAPPPASDAVRKGEGEQDRAGPLVEVPLPEAR